MSNLVTTITETVGGFANTLMKAWKAFAFYIAKDMIAPMVYAPIDKATGTVNLTGPLDKVIDNLGWEMFSQ